MADPLTMSATEFSRQFGRVKEDVREHGVVRVVSHNRLVGGFLSPRELQLYERLKREQREVIRAGEVPDDLVDALHEQLARTDR